MSELDKKSRDKNFTLVGELTGRELDVPEYSNLNIHSGDSWSIIEEEFDTFTVVKFKKKEKDGDNRGGE